MELKDKLSVMITTHIINVNTEPYLNNDMIIDTIQSSHNMMALEGVTYYVYIDSFYKVNYPKYYELYVNILENKFRSKLPDIDIQIVSDSLDTQQANWKHMIENCNTPYFMFLEHDWEFLEPINTKNILSDMDRYERFSYIRFSRWPVGHPQELRWDKSYGGVYETETEIGKDINLPLTKVALYSGNPHIVKLSKCKEFYLTKLNHRNLHNRKSYLEKEFLDIIVNDIRLYGNQKAHEMWGVFLYGTVDNPKPILKHLGDWCRKS